SLHFSCSPLDQWVIGCQAISRTPQQGTAQPAREVLLYVLRARSREREVSVRADESEPGAEFDAGEAVRVADVVRCSIELARPHQPESTYHALVDCGPRPLGDRRASYREEGEV